MDWVTATLPASASPASSDETDLVMGRQPASACRESFPDSVLAMVSVALCAGWLERGALFVFFV